MFVKEIKRHINCITIIRAYLDKVMFNVSPKELYGSD